jgi:plastocyanin
VSNSEKGLPEKSVNKFKKIQDYAFPLGIMAISLIIVYILWSAFGYIGPTFSRDVLTNQQEMLREKYKLPPLEAESGAAGEIPPSLREVMKSNTTKTSNSQVETTTQPTTTSTTATSESSGNATTTSGSIQQEGQQQQQPQATEGTAGVTLTILEGSSVQGNPDYDPDELTVKKGDTILVNNADTMPHTVTNGESSTDPNSAKIFDTSIIMGGESAELETSNVDAGTYPYYCMVHPYMTGSLTIT